MPTKTEQPIITTLTLSVQTITIGNKSMTIAVFKQLRERSPFLDDGSLRDTVTLWGTVKHQTHQRQREDDQQWVVFEEHGALAKYPLRPDRLRHAHTVPFERWVQLGGFGDTPVTFKTLARVLRETAPEGWVQKGGDARSDLWVLLIAADNRHRLDEVTPERVQVYLQLVGPTEAQKLRQAWKLATDLAHTHNASAERLGALTQLFIAV